MAKQPETIFDFDVTKYIGEFKVPGFDLDALVASQRKNIEALTQANKLAFDGVQAAVKREIEILRQTLEEAATVTKELVEGVSPQEKITRQTELAKEAFERGVANARELSEIITKSNSQAIDLLNKRYVQLLDEVKETVSKIKAK
ncbi:MAG TPA: phasin family protein [Candidatus Sulfotelmatobacter sp.]|jgi:phasin family protein|nr:phasin family protein [Candidatus Sulfotelmatobacter sp.]